MEGKRKLASLLGDYASDSESDAESTANDSPLPPATHIPPSVSPSTSTHPKRLKSELSPDAEFQLVRHGPFSQSQPLPSQITDQAPLVNAHAIPVPPSSLQMGSLPEGFFDPPSSKLTSLSTSGVTRPLEARTHDTITQHNSSQVNEDQTLESDWEAFQRELQETELRNQTINDADEIRDWIERQERELVYQQTYEAKADRLRHLYSSRKRTQSDIGGPATISQDLSSTTPQSPVGVSQHAEENSSSGEDEEENWGELLDWRARKM
ncbi:hypothetical protein IWQ61_003052 [Dispira simplex]|nr:hypothetical protein IWQ61_003052 [Dispira simplex]